MLSSARDSRRGTGRTSGGDSGTARRASARTPARSDAERVKLTMTRSHASTPSRAWMSAIARNVASTSRVDAEGRPDRPGQRARCARPPTRPSAAGPPSTRRGSRTLPPASGDVAALPTRAAELRPHRATVAGRPDHRGARPDRRTRHGRRSEWRRAGARRARASSCAARRRGSASARARRRASRRRRVRARGATPCWVARLGPKPTRCARSVATRPPGREARGRIGWPWRRASPRPSRWGSRRGRHRPTCPIEGTARTRADACRSLPGSSLRSISRYTAGSVVKIVWSNNASTARTSSSGSGRCRRIGSVRQRPAISSRMRRRTSCSSEAPSGRSSNCSRSEPIRHRCSTTARRFASVGCAVNTGVIRMSS